MLKNKKEVETNFKSQKLEKALREKGRDYDEPFVIYSQNKKTKVTFKNEQSRVQEIVKLLSVCHD